MDFNLKIYKKKLKLLKYLNNIKNVQFKLILQSKVITLPNLMISS